MGMVKYHSCSCWVSGWVSKVVNSGLGMSLAIVFIGLWVVL